MMYKDTGILYTGSQTFPCPPGFLSFADRPALQTCRNWTADQKELLFEIAANNSQVYYILGDMDVKAFYKKILKNTKVLTENGKIVKEALENNE